jgi:iron-sulfur cluster assembly protein/iron-sulfur cluster insertion protein
MFFEAEIASDDVVSVHQAGDVKVRVVVDLSSAVLLAGARLDYKNGLEQSGFHVSNPNAQRTCGCGQSFS